ncbi:hypothetical protein M569_09325, partial [Genlisea aurea]
NILVVASITKILSKFGALQYLEKNADSIPLSEDVVLQIVHHRSLVISKKLEFFRWCSSRPDYNHTANAYSEMLRAIFRFPNQHHNNVIELLALMKRDGVILDSDTLKRILNGLIRAQKFDYALDVLDYIEKDSVIAGNLSPDVYSPVLVALVRKDQISIALPVFFKLLHSQFEDYIPDAFACNELLAGLKKKKMKNEFREVFAKLRETARYPSDRWGYNICIHSFGCWGDLSTALSLFKEMKDRGGSVYPDLCTYNSLIQVFCSLGRLNDALVIWKELKNSSGYEPDRFTYRILIQGCSKSYRINDAMTIFNEMQYNGIRAETVTYNSLMDGLFKSRKLTTACSFFERMVDNRVRASCSTYNIIIDGLYRNGRPEAAYALFSDLKRKGNQFVDVISFSIVVLHLCKEERLDEALRLVEEMESRGFVVDLVTVTSLLMALYRAGHSDFTEKLMKHVRNGNLIPSVFKWKSALESSLMSPQGKERDFTPMFPEVRSIDEILEATKSVASTRSEDGTVKNGDEGEERADEWSSSPYMDELARNLSGDHRYSSHFFTMFRAVRAVGRGEESFDVDMANTYLSLLSGTGKLSSACKVLELLSRGGVGPNSESSLANVFCYGYNSLTSSFIKKGYVKEAWGILLRHFDAGPADVATYSLIVRGLGKMGRADLARSVRDKLTRDGGYLDAVMYNTLIHTLGKAGRLEDARNVFGEMRASGIIPDVVTYNTLIEVHSKAGDVEEANRWLKTMLDNGCAPNHVTDTTLDYLEKEIRKQK